MSMGLTSIMSLTRLSRHAVNSQTLQVTQSIAVQTFSVGGIGEVLHTVAGPGVNLPERYHTVGGTAFSQSAIGSLHQQDLIAECEIGANGASKCHPALKPGCEYHLALAHFLLDI